MATQQAATTAAAPWKSLLSRSLAQNSNLPYAKYMQLASTRQDGRPAVRTVVFRWVLSRLHAPYGHCMLIEAEYCKAGWCGHSPQ